MRWPGRRDADPKLERLAAVPFLSSCDREELQEIARHLDEVDIPEGDVLMREGRPGFECFIIGEGEAEVSIRGEARASLGPGAIVGEMALTGDGYRSATVTALTPMRLFATSVSGFSALMDHQPVAGQVAEDIKARIQGAAEHPPAS